MNPDEIKVPKSHEQYERFIRAVGSRMTKFECKPAGVCMFLADGRIACVIPEDTWFTGFLIYPSGKQRVFDVKLQPKDGLDFHFFVAYNELPPG